MPCAGDCKEIEVKEYKYYVQQIFSLGPLFVFQYTPSSFMCEALFLVKEWNVDCRLWEFCCSCEHVSPSCSAPIQVQELKMEIAITQSCRLLMPFMCWKGGGKLSWPPASDPRFFWHLSSWKEIAEHESPTKKAPSTIQIFSWDISGLEKNSLVACACYEDQFQLLGKRQEKP